MTDPFKPISDAIASLAQRVRKLEVKPIPSGGASTPYTLEDHDHSGDPADGGQFPLINLTSPGATAGQIPNADGTGNITWQDPSGGTGLAYKIYLWDLDLAVVTAFDPDATGFAAAIAASESNDTITVPDGTYALDIAIPAGVSIKGLSRLFCTIIGTVTMGNGSTLQEVSVKPSGNSASVINGIIAQASGISNVIQCDVVPVNIGAGGVNALYSSTDDIEINVKECTLDGRGAAVGSDGYAAYYESGSSGKVFIYNSICLGSVADDPFNV